ncbi:DUF2140 family protein [Vagococcus silagei]|uniref:DUF2140 family protein n=2 Tax=Vagococcus silagei TaxID=2508885 RepID=A0A4S3B6C3_9ENTE|nr:DUF2140 family protein [Vagococcus silagei]
MDGCERMKNRKGRVKVQKKVQKNNFFSNPWRIAFLTVIALIIGAFLFIGSRIFTSRTTYDPSQPKVELKGEPAVQIKMKKEQVNRLVTYYFKDFINDSDVDLHFVLENNALVQGTFPILGHNTKFYLYFEPYVINDGNVQLRAKELSIGTLNVPISAVMNYMTHSIDFPNWIDVDSKQNMITLHLDQFALKNGMSVKANKINLIDDQISFDLYLPK